MPAWCQCYDGYVFGTHRKLSTTVKIIIQPFNKIEKNQQSNIILFDGWQKSDNTA